MAARWIFADGLGFTLKGGPETVCLAFSSLDKYLVHHFAKVFVEILFEKELVRSCFVTDFAFGSIAKDPLACMIFFTQRLTSNPNPKLS